MTHPLLPTQEQFAEWDSEYFDGERQNFDVMMIKAFQAGADQQLERVIEWIRSMSQYPYMYMWDNAPELEKDDLINDLKKAMRPQQQEDN